MTSASIPIDSVALMLFQNLKEGMESGRIANVNTAQAEVEAAIAELSRKRQLEEPTHVRDLVHKLFLEVGSLREKVTKCEAQLAEVQCQAKILREDTTQNVAHTEACNPQVEQQQKETAMEGAKASMTVASSHPAAPAPSPTDPVLRPAPSRIAIVSFPGGSRTITIHPPDSPHYQSVVRDEKGDVIIDFRRTKPLHREGAFRGPIEEIDWREITRVCGRGPEPRGSRPAPPRWPDLSQPPCPPRSHCPSDIIARQHQLSTSMKTDAFGRVLPSELHNAKSPSLPTGLSSSPSSSQESQSSSSAKHDVDTTPSSTPSSPSVGRGQKRTRTSDDGDSALLATEPREPASLPIDPRTIQEPTTPTPVKRQESHLEGPLKRKKLRSSASLEGLHAHSLLDPTHTV